MPERLQPDVIIQMRSQGLSDNDIVSQLRSQGYTSQQIFDALSQADLTATQTPPSMQGGPLPNLGGGGEPLPPIDNQMPPPQGTPSILSPSQGPIGPQSEERMQEIIEAVIEEKWDQLVGDIQKIVTWKDKIESKFQVMESNLDNLKKDFQSLQQSLIKKVSEYDDNIKNVGSQLDAVGKVFKEVIPEFTENVHKLNRISSKLDKAPETQNPKPTTQNTEPITPTFAPRPQKQKKDVDLDSVKHLF